MSYWEMEGRSDDWFTPKYIFDALECRFDIDVAAPFDRTFISVPANEFITENSLEKEWNGFVWCNPPFGGRNGITPWLRKAYSQGNGIFLSADRTSAPWWHEAADNADAVLFIKGKVKFIRPDGTFGPSPSNGTSLFAFGKRAMHALIIGEGNGLGKYMKL